MLNQLSRMTGEFVSPEREAAFQATRCFETLRQLRLLFLISAVINTLFFVSDWRFQGTSHFQLVLPARSTVVLISILCALLIQHTRNFSTAEQIALLWCGTTALSVAILVTSQSDIALFVVFMLPLIFYLAVPISFRWNALMGLGCSFLMLIGYLLPDPSIKHATGLMLAVLVFNIALILVITRSNRLQRTEWSAVRAAQQANADLAAHRGKLEKMFMAVPIPLVVSDADGAIIRFNDAARTFFSRGGDPGQIKNIDEVYANPGERENLRLLLSETGRIGGYETRLRLIDGSERDVLLAATVVDIGGNEAIMTGTVDITERKAMECRLEQLATTDPLTGLANRTQFFTAVAAGIRGQKHGQLAMVLLDVDHFKQINDALGHDAGDMLLKTFADRLRSSVRMKDIVARLGGDEFAIMLTDLTDQDQLDRAIDSILARLRDPFVYAGHMLECKASFGASIFPLHADNADDLMKDADIALYMAKMEGRGRAVLFRPEMRSVMEKRSFMIRDASKALEEDRILPYYQPKVSFRTGSIVGFEALLRWHDAAGLVQPPAKIVAAFDDPEVAVELSNRMANRVIGDIRRWLDDGIDFGHIGLNASAVEFRQDNFAERILDQLRQADVPHDRLELEVTETVFLGRGAEYVHRALDMLSNAGVRIALDDFGTGYASLSHLKQFPVDILKIDQSFVRDLEIDPDDAAIVRAVINLGQSLGIGIVAEGVETVAQARNLAEQGCDYGQGFLFSRPAPARDVPGVLAARAKGGSWWINQDPSSWAAA